MPSNNLSILLKFLLLINLRFGDYGFFIVVKPFWPKISVGFITFHFYRLISINAFNLKNISIDLAFNLKSITTNLQDTYNKTYILQSKQQQ